MTERLCKVSGQGNIRQLHGGAEERGNIPGAESGNAAAQSRDPKMQLRVFSGIADEFVHMGCDGLRPSMHGGNGVTAALATAPFEKDGTELPQGRQRGAPAGVFSDGGE